MTNRLTRMVSPVRRSTGRGGGGTSGYDAFISYSHSADLAFAPSLQRGLRNLAKPWNRRYALRVFLDQTSLAGSADLKSDLDGPIARSEFFILLASAEAAGSPWVGKEVSYWLDNKEMSKFLIAKTDGEISWDEATNDFDWETTTALPRSLAKAFPSEPNFVDFSAEHWHSGVSLRDPAFKTAVARLAAPIHGKELDELVGEDIKQQRRTRRLVRSAVATLVVLLIAASAAAVLAYQQRNAANERARVAQSQALAAEAEGALSTAPATALADSVEAIDTSATPEARVALRHAILSNPIEYLIPAGPADRRDWIPGTGAVREALTFSGDGKLLVGLTPAGSLHIWQSADGRPVARTIPRSKAPRVADPASAVSPDGRFLATIRNDAELWSKNPRRRIARLGPAVRVLFSHDGRLLVTVGENGDAGIWRTGDGRLVAALPAFGSLGRGPGVVMTPFTPGAAFSPDGRLLALAGADGIVRVWELATSKQVAAVAMGWANTLVFDPHGSRLAGMTWDGDVVVARAPASVALRTGFGPHSCFESFAPVVSRDGRRLVARAAGGAGVWNVDGERLQLLRTPARPAGIAAVVTAAFSGDGRTVAVSATVGDCYAANSSQQQWTAVWHSAGRSPSHRFPQAFGIQLDPRGSLVATGGTAWRTASGARVPSLDGIVGLSPDGRLALMRRDWTATVVRVGSGAAVATLRGFGGFRLDGVSAIFSPDGRRVVTLRDYTLHLWDTATGEPLGRLGQAGEIVDGHSFSRDGRLVLVRFGDRVATFGVADGSPVSSLAGDYAAISPDGSLAAAPKDDGSVEVVDLATGLRVAAQTDTAEPLVSASFGPTPGLLVTVDAVGDVHVLRCAICGSEDVLLTRARAMLALVSKFQPQRPPEARVR